MTITFNVICFELSLINAPILHCHNPVSFFEPIDITTLIFSAICPFLMTVTVLQVIEPLTSIRSTILPKENSFSLKFAINPIPFIHISIVKYFTTLTIEFILLPIPLYNGSTCINQASGAFSLLINQLTLIHRSIGQRDWTPPFYDLLLRKFERFYSAVDFLDYGWTMLRYLLKTDYLVVRLFISQKKQVDTRLPIYTFASLTVAHLNYNSNYLKTVQLVFIDKFISDSQTYYRCFDWPIQVIISSSSQILIERCLA